MKHFKVFTTAILAISLLLVVSACSSKVEVVDSSPMPVASPSGQIYLYGEANHGEELILEAEFEIWSEYYHNEGMRHLFVELPYFTGELLNLWMQSDNEEILDEIYSDWEGTAADVPATKEFYRKVKENCPETVFHGTDVGHQYNSAGERFLKHLEENDLKDSENYMLTLENVEQGKYYYRDYDDQVYDDVYRENKIAENFIREFSLLDGEDVMGIYGAAHTDPDSLDFTNSVPSMANQLKEHYGSIVHHKKLILE